MVKYRSEVTPKGQEFSFSAHTLCYGSDTEFNFRLRPISETRSILAILCNFANSQTFRMWVFSIGVDMSSEQWKPFDTGNMVIKGYEVSSLGRVRKVKTGEILQVSDEPKNSGVSPHLCVDKSWWRPDILVSFVFRQPIQPIVAPVEPAVIQPVEALEVAADDFEPKAEYKSRKKRQQARDRELVGSAGPSLELQLAEMLYKPYVKPYRLEHKPSQSQDYPQTPQDHAAQKVSAVKDQPVHGVAKVLNLYKASAQKRGHAWELTDKQAIALMVAVCRYCGCDPGTHNQNGLNGIDRVDSSQGYIEANVVPCCGKCNMMKGTRTPDEFLGHVVSIVEYQNEKQVFV